MDSHPTVYVINQPAPQRANKQQIVYDVTPALEWGNIRFIFKADAEPPAFDVDKAISHARSILKDIHPRDYIVWAGGDPIAMAIVFPIAAEFLQGKIRLLRWEKSKYNNNLGAVKGCYTPFLINTKH